MVAALLYSPILYKNAFTQFCNPLKIHDISSNNVYQRVIYRAVLSNVGRNEWLGMVLPSADE